MVRNFLKLLPLIFLLACSQDATTVLRVQLPTEDAASVQILSTMMVGLMTYDRENNLKPAIALDSEKLDGGKKYRLHLRPWKWSDGKDVTAFDFVYALRRTLHSFVNVEVHALSKDQIEFTLEKPIEFFLDLLALPIAYPQRQDSTATTGAYHPVHFEQGQKLELERNPYFKEFGRNAPQKIDFIFISDESTVLSLFEREKIDIAFTASGSGPIKTFPYFSTFYIGFDQTQFPWNHREARLAIAQAINRGSMVSSRSDMPGMSWIPDGLFGANPKIGIPYSPDSAREHWKNVLKKGSSLPPLYFSFGSGDRDQVLAEKLRKNLKENLGIELHLDSNKSALFGSEWRVPFPHPYAHFFNFHINASYDKLLQKLSLLPATGTETQRVVDQLQKLLLEDTVAIVPIFHYQQEVLISPRVKDFSVNEMGMLFY